MSENDFVKKGADVNSCELKLNGDKIKLETRPSNKESTASSKCALLGRGQTRPLSAVPLLSLYHKDDYDIDTKTRRPYSADNLLYKSNNLKHKGFMSNTEDSTSLESLEEEKHLPSTQLYNDLISEPIKSYRSHSASKQQADIYEKPLEATSSEESLGMEPIEEKKDHFSICPLTPGLTTKPPLPKRLDNKLSGLKDQNTPNIKNNNLLNDHEIETIRLKSLKFEEDFMRKSEKHDLDNKVKFKMQEIMSEREFNNFLERTQTEIEEKVAEDLMVNDIDFHEVKTEHNLNNLKQVHAAQLNQSFSDRQYHFEMEPADILTSKSDNDLNFRNWLSEDKNATNKVSKSEERTNAFLKNLKNQHEEIDKCINKAQKVLEKTKRSNVQDPKDSEEKDARNRQEQDVIDLKFNKFFEQSSYDDKPAKKILKNNHPKLNETKSKLDGPQKKKDKLNSLNETKKNKLKFIPKPINSVKDFVTGGCHDEESWMAKYPPDNKDESIREDVGPPSFNSTAVDSKVDDNIKVNEWLRDDRLSKSSEKNSNFLDILENIEDLDIATRVTEKEVLDMPQHDNEVRTEVSETNTYDDIVQILEVLEAEDRKSHMNMESIKDIVNQELHIQDHENQSKITSEQLPIIKITDTSSRSSSATSKSSDQGLGSTSSLNSCTSNYNQILSFLDEVDRNSSKTLTCAKERVQQVAKVVQSAIRLDTVPKREDLMSLTNQELYDQIIDLNLRLKEKSSSIKVLQDELSSVRDQVLKLTKQTEDIVKQKLRAQKEEHEAIVKRHQKFIDQLINDKKALNQQCEGLISEIKMLEDRNSSNMKAAEHRHQVELKKVKEMQMAGEKIRRERWIDSKTQKIKELTVKSLEPELQSMTLRNQQEISDLRSLHKKELEDLELKAARKTQQQCETLREQLAEEREKALAHEREIMRQRYEKLVENEEKGYQEQRRRLQQEHANRVMECEERENAALVERDRAIKQAQEEFEDKLQTIIRRHNNEMKLLKETIDMETEAWKNNYRKQQTIQLIEKEAKMRDHFKKERDREIEEVIERLETEANETRLQMEQTTENRVRRIKEKFENEIRDLEQSEREAKTKYAETKSKLLECEDTIIGLRANAKQLEMQLNDSREALEKMNRERNQLKNVVRKEMKQDIESLEKEVSKIREEKDKELQQVYSRVKIAVAKKDEVLSELTRDHTALQEKCVYLENMLEQQRKEYLIK